MISDFAPSARSYHMRNTLAMRRLAPARLPRSFGAASRGPTRLRFFALAALVLAGALAVLLRPTLATAAFVATEHPLAVAAGVEILERGGNAVDAAIAAAAAIGVANPLSCGIGGGGFMLAYEAASGRARILDYREVAPGAATPERFRREGVDRITRGALSIAVPGEPAGLAAAHERMGSLPMKIVLAPAIRLARDGFAIETHLAEGIVKNRDFLGADPTLRAVFLDSAGEPRRVGEVIRRPDLASTLERLALEGPQPFYVGEIADAIATTVAARGGLLRGNDLKSYRVHWREPLVGAYRGRTVLTMPPPGSGGVLLAALNVLSGYDLAALGIGTPTYLHLLAETMKVVFHDRARFYGDPAFVDVPIRRLTSPEYAREIRSRLSSTRVLDLGDLGHFDAGTSHISVVDAQGNAAAVTTTINTAFGSGVVAEGTGIILNNEMADFSLEPGASNVFGLVATEANVVGPGKRPLSSMIPTVFLREGRPEIVIGASGGPTIITSVLQTALGIIDFGLSASAAAAAPRIHHQGAPRLLLVEPGIPEPVRRALEVVGHSIKQLDSLGAVSVVQVTSAGMSGAGAVRKGGAAAGPD